MKRAWWMLLGSQIAIVVGFWAWDHIDHPLGNQFLGAACDRYLAFGRLSGLLAALGVMLQLVLIGRLGRIERLFGMDRLSRLHHGLGFALGALILAHPVLVTIGRARSDGSSIGAAFVDLLRAWDGVLPAAIGVLLLVPVLAFAAAVMRQRVRYEVWYATHLGLYAVVALILGHQIAVGYDFHANAWFRGYWIAVWSLVALAFVVYRFLLPLRTMLRHRFVIARLQPETPEVTSVHLDGRRLDAFRACAGQFLIVRFWQPGFRAEAHPFSISCRPDGQHLRLSIKALGDFTRRIPQLRPGTRVLVDGPHGAFTPAGCRREKVLLIAGGIGITPLRAMAEEFSRAGRDVILLYSNRTRASIVFERELADLAAAGRLKVFHVLSDDAAWPGEKGRIDRERIARLAPDASDREAYLCGAPAFMKRLRGVLRGLGIPNARIHDENFAL